MLLNITLDNVQFKPQALTQAEELSLTLLSQTDDSLVFSGNSGGLQGLDVISQTYVDPLMAASPGSWATLVVTPEA